MRVTLHTTAGPEAGRRIDLRDGLTANVGRSEWSDFSFEKDQAMAEVHFAIRCEGQKCFLEPQQTEPTLLNGEATGEVRLHTADKIQAGKTEFTIVIEGDDGRSDDASIDADDEDRPEPPEVAALIGYLALDDELRAMAESSESETAFLKQLIEEEHFQPASRLQAHLLDNQRAVWWGCLCLDQLLADNLADKQAAGREAAGNWAIDPTEQNRRRAEVAAEIADYEGPGGMLATAAFWSGESLAPSDAIEAVPPDERLTGQAVANAILVACITAGPDRIQEKLKESLEIARDLVDGKIELPSPSTSVDN